MESMSSPVASRKSFGQILEKLGESNPDIVCLDADLSKSTMSKFFAEKFPERFFEMGIQEANMIGCAAGLSFTGKIPFICSFAAFLSGRFDQIRMSIAYARANVKIVGTHCGVGIGEDGHSQMGLEDLALMRTLPGMVVLQPGHHRETTEMVEWAVQHKGPVYLRLTRQALTSFDQGMDLKSYQEVTENSQMENLVVLASGGTLGPAVEASRSMGEKGPKVFNASCIKPLPEKFLESLAKKHQHWVSVEDHTVYGGLGSSLAEWLTTNAPGVKLDRLGIQDQFGESGTPESLYALHGLDAKGLEKSFRRILGPALD